MSASKAQSDTHSSWDVVIGLEVHVQLNTRTKLFESALACAAGEPNTHVGCLSLGMPGTLPVVNQEAVRKAILFALSIQAQPAKISVFDRKNYFYHDLPKGYQISQNQHPIVGPGVIMIHGEEGSKAIRIHHAHLEEDAGKSINDLLPGQIAIDLNRAGVALLEIVSEPDLKSPQEAVLYFKALHRLCRAIGICDGHLQEGSMRCDANVSVRPTPDHPLGVRSEIKNLNSFRFLEQAIQYEIQRQIEVLSRGGTLSQETRGFDAKKQQTYTLRSKENAHDYRYFPDPDLPPILVTEQDIEQAKLCLPELPDEVYARLQKDYQMSSKDALCVMEHDDWIRYMDACVLQGAPIDLLRHWMLGVVAAMVNQHQTSLDVFVITPSMTSALLDAIKQQKISNHQAKLIWEALIESQEKSVHEWIENYAIKESDFHAIDHAIEQVIKQYPQQVQEYKQGKTKLIGFFVGHVMKALHGRGNPAWIQECILKILSD